MAYLGIAGIVFLVDFFLKKSMEKKKYVKKYVCKGKIRLHLHHNYSGIFDSLPDKPKLVHRVSLVSVILLTLYYLITLGHRGERIRKIGLSLLLGGAYSNTYERMTKEYVTDYFSFETGIKKLDKIIFNLSDLAIMIGSVLWVLGKKQG